MSAQERLAARIRVWLDAEPLLYLDEGDLADYVAARLIADGVSVPAEPGAPDPYLAGLQRNDMGRVLALALSSQGYAQTDSEAVGLALLGEIEECGYTLRLTTHEERREKNDRGMSS